MNSNDYKLNIIVNYNGKKIEKKFKDMIKLEEIKSLAINDFKLSKEEEKNIKFKNENKNKIIETDKDIIDCIDEIDEENYKININLLINKSENNNKIVKQISNEFSKINNEGNDLDLSKSNSSILTPQKEETYKRIIKEYRNEYKKYKSENESLKSEISNIKKENENIKNNLSIEYKKSLSEKINKLNLNHEENTKQLKDENEILRNENKDLDEKCKKLENENLELKNKIKELESNKILFDKNEQNNYLANSKLKNTFEEMKYKEIEKEIISQYNNIIKGQIEKTIQNEFNKLYKDKDLEKEKIIENQNIKILEEIKSIKEILKNQNSKEDNEINYLKSYVIIDNKKKENEKEKEKEKEKLNDLNMDRFSEIFKSNNNITETNDNETNKEEIKENLNINDDKINNENNKEKNIKDNVINNPFHELVNENDNNSNDLLLKKFSNESISCNFLSPNLQDNSYFHEN